MKWIDDYMGDLVIQEQINERIYLGTGYWAAEYRWVLKPILLSDIQGYRLEQYSSSGINNSEV